jgi:hypothetical protein
MNKPKTPENYSGKFTEFHNQPIRLLCGDYKCDETISLTVDKKTFTFPHPIIITKFIKNMSQKTMKVELAFRRYEKWEYITVDKEVISKSKTITSLSAFPIMVTDDNARGLVAYLHSLERLNEKNIPMILSTSSFGYVPDEGFLPYCDNIEFSEKVEFRRIFESIKQTGDLKYWISNLSILFQHSKILNTVVSASFASILLNPIGGQPFFVHLHGESGTGKTAALYIAASVWANPEKYKITFNSTPVSMELFAGVLNELPLCINEYQLKNDNKNQKHFNPYLLAEGEGKSRANKGLGLQETFYWNNVIITTGETRLSSESGGSGELNRVVEFEINKTDDLFQSSQLAGSFYEFTKNNHGYAGKAFVKWFYGNKNNLKTAKDLVEKYECELLSFGISSKQARAGAFILTANKLINSLFFKNDSLLLNSDWLAKSLKTEHTVDITLRAYEKLCDWITINYNKFIHKYNYVVEETGIKKVVTSPVNNDCYGEYDKTDENNIIVYIIKSVFDKVCEEYKFDPRSVLSGLKRKNLIKCSKDLHSITKRIDGCVARVVCLYINSKDCVE